MKKSKIILLAISILLVTYSLFLFVLPRKIDLDQYSPQIADAIKNETGFQFDLEGLRLHSSWNSLGIMINRADLKYPNGEKFAQINNLQADISVLHLLLREIEIKKVASSQVIVRLKESKPGELEIEKYLAQRKLKGEKSYFKFSDKMPDLIAQKYNISFIEAQTSRIYSIKGNDLKISDFVLNKKIKIKSKGEAILAGRKQITYDFTVFSKVFPKDNGQKFDIIKIFDDLYEYNAKANINANLRISGEDKVSDIVGKAIFDKISFTIGGKTFPASSLNLDFKGDSIKINSNLYIGPSSKAVITGAFQPGKFIDLKVKSDSVRLENAFFIYNKVLKILGKKTFDSIEANGVLKADFSIKSDLKKIQSSGYFRIMNANITDKSSKVYFTRVNADVDFSQDTVNIRQAKAYLNNQPITINGKIDKFANADITILADKLPLKGAILALGSGDILKENDINGLVHANIALKGRLDKASPSIKILINDICIKNIKNKIPVKISQIDLSSNAKNSGKIQVLGVKISPDFASKIAIPKILASYTGKNLTIEKTAFNIDNIKALLYGKISDIDSSPKFNGVNISIAPQVVSIQGYANSSMSAKGNFILVGPLSKPIIKGSLTIPTANIPSISTYLKNAVIAYSGGNIIDVNVEHLLMANSLMSLSAQLSNNHKGLVVKNLDFKARNFDLNSLVPLFRILPKKSRASLTVTNGKSTIEHFKVGDIASSDIVSDIAVTNNVLTLKNLRGDAYAGKIAGNINYNLGNGKISLDLQGRGLTANPAIMAITRRNDDINGVLDFDSDISLLGGSKRDIMNSLQGDVKFIISNGKMGVLGKFEHLLYAQNILSNSVFKATLNALAKAISVKNTGVYKYMKGKVAFGGGWADIDWIKTSGPSMSLYMSGRYNLSYNTASLTILGRISDDIVRILGPVGDLSMDKVISTIPQIGEITSTFANQYTVNPHYEDLSLIPPLSLQTQFKTKVFKVIIDGDIQKQTSVKSFKWISSPKIVQNPSYSPPKPEIHAVPDFVNKLPDLRN